MLQVIVYALLTATSVAILCNIQPDFSACETTTVSNCQATCSLYKSQESCDSSTLCTWTSTEIFPGAGVFDTKCEPVGFDSTDCELRADQAGCADENCTWRTQPCEVRQNCAVTGTGTCESVETESECTIQGAHCTWRNECATLEHLCEVPKTIPDCVATAGCYWAAGSTTIDQGANGIETSTGASCGPCRVDPITTQNEFLGAQSKIGKVCSRVFQGFGTVSFAVLSASSNSDAFCTDGVAHFAPGEGFTCVDTSAPSAAPNTNTAAPSAAPQTNTAAPSAAPNTNTAAPSAAPNSKAPTTRAPQSPNAGAVGCGLNAAKTACASSTGDYCVQTCSIYKGQASCTTITGCEWKVSTVMGTNFGACIQTVPTTDCASRTRAACTGTCTWSTNPCEEEAASCSGGAACTASTSTACLAAGAMCVWEPNCVDSTPCRMANGETACLATSGCFFASATTSVMGMNLPTSTCSSCFTDDSKIESEFLSAQASLNKKCTTSMAGFSMSSTTTSVKPGVGCDGGKAAAPRTGVTCGEVNAAGTSSLIFVALVTISSFFSA